MHLQLDQNNNLQIVNWGQPNWGTAENYPNSVVVDIGNQVVPTDAPLDHYRYIDGEFVLSPLPEPPAEVRRNDTLNRYQLLVQGLEFVVNEDRAYAITARLMAYKDGATLQAIMGITSRATAQAYVTSKPEWTGATAATRALVGDVLETLAGMMELMLLIRE